MSGKVVQMHKDRNRVMVERRLHRQAAHVMGSSLLPYGWQPLVEVSVPPEEAEEIVGIFENGRCRVELRAITNPFVRGGKPMGHLAIAERGRPLEWNEMLQVQREVCGPAVNGAEVFPSTTLELVGERRRHLFVLMGGEEWPFMLAPPAVQQRRAEEAADAAQVAAYLRKQTVLYCLPTAEGQPVRVCRDAADAAASGVEGELREGIAVAIPQDEHTEWSAAATAFREEVAREAEALRDRLRAARQAAVEPTMLDVPDPISAEEAEAQAAREAEAEAAAEAELVRLRAELRKE